MISQGDYEYSVGDAAPSTQIGDEKKHEKFVHQRSRPFPCQLCTKRFGSNADLKRHYVVHSYGCDQCNESFTNPSGLIVHNRKSHGS